MPRETAGGLLTKSFTLSSEEVQAIEDVKKETGLRSDSAALRRLIQDGVSYRAMERKVKEEMFKKLSQ